MRKLKGFTLVEILIVIVIIGILIGALVPRMQSAQGRARDVARKNDLNQLQSAVITSYSDRGKWPAIDGATSDETALATGGITVDKIEDELYGAGLNGIPKDPISTNSVRLGADSNDNMTDGQYGYLVAMKNGVQDAGFVLMAHMEVEGGANWVYCDDGTATIKDEFKEEDYEYDGGLITNSDDLKNIVACTSLTYHKGETQGCGVGKDDDDIRGGTECHYDDPKELRYILMY